MKKAEEKPAVEMTVGGKPKSGASHPPWKSLRDSHIPTARRLLYIFKTFARKEPSSAIASGYGFRLILRLEKTAVRNCRPPDVRTDGAEAEFGAVKRCYHQLERRMVMHGCASGKA